MHASNGFHTCDSQSALAERSVRSDWFERSVGSVGRTGRAHLNKPNEPEHGFYSGGHGEGETPVPIPNTAVKPLSAGST